MTKTEYREYIASEDWQTRRKTFIGRHPFCYRCYIPRWLAQIVYDQDLHVHHRSYNNLGSETWSDLEVLCRRCHDLKTFGRSDFKAPHSHKCPSCGHIHFDGYSDDCERCAEAKAGSFDMPDAVLLTDVDMGWGHVFVWEEMVREIATVIGPDTLLEYLAEGEHHLRREHEMHQQHESALAERRKAFG